MYSIIAPFSLSLQQIFCNSLKCLSGWLGFYTSTKQVFSGVYSVCSTRRDGAFQQAHSFEKSPYF